MIIYNTPSTVAFHYRQQFHAMQKQDDDTTLDWFKRLQHSVEKCEFDHMLSDYMLIDKFVSGLNDYDFEKISKVPTWTTDELVLVVIGNAHIFINPQPNIDCIEIEIKNEVSEKKSFIQFSKHFPAHFFFIPGRKYRIE